MYDAPRTITAGPRTSSMAWGHQQALELNEQIKGAFGPTIPLTSPTTLRPSPSSPAELANVAAGRLVPGTVPQRPVSHFDSSPGRPRTSIISLASTKLKAPQHLTIPAPLALDRNLVPRAEDWQDGDDLWPPVSPGEGSLRPFSFAVRAGAGTGRESSEGHGRRSFFGRFGNSVTSLFGGSHAGSGSMMNMQ
jgi:hypothetical protein